MDLRIKIATLKYNRIYGKTSTRFLEAQDTPSFETKDSSEAAKSELNSVYTGATKQYVDKTTTQCTIGLNT